ncbi:hypothetical protein ENUP19_0162G0024 [Entamoeba nuttalli]|uniref:NADP-dependent alcohol dehydrogenase, putative n=2 Tax=Entamoeba nuttalli TaxID=412467 RepID=K2HZB4_ENTNP|nr:NADP-dependent alcohol dehydrogenase, putative [Entamoeba nuttalli P19]EKE41770.1 NADP-dependent alcohol dehydrogenase, putative [Entamoeba nuttalli P19]|eukprot:XP_008855895.1 NADP-dependent alcohol dehydrogenase, putative [Entamoeba nuttalli P19]
MKGLCFSDENQLEIIEVEKPQINHETDAIVKITFASICSSDIHILKGKVPRAKKGVILGHEGVGEVVEIGKDVKKIKVGDHVSINCITFCGNCWFCQHGYINNCEYGGWEIGCRENGTMAEYVRIPFADSSLNVIPKEVKDEQCLLVGDVLSSGYFGVELGEVKEGDIVTVIGCGPVGLCSMLCCKMKKAKVIALDINTQCLEYAQKLHCCDWSFNPHNCDIVNEILSITNNRGCDCTIENAGTNESFELSWKLTRPNGIVALVAMYESNQPFPLPLMYGKNLIFKTGGVDAIHCDELIEKIKNKEIDTMPLLTQQFTFGQILSAFHFFQNKPTHCVKVVIQF